MSKWIISKRMRFLFCLMLFLHCKPDKWIVLQKFSKQMCSRIPTTLNHDSAQEI